MDAGTRTRQCCRTRESRGLQTGGGSRQICLKMDRELYGRIRANPREVRALIHEQLRQTPELFPAVTVILCSLHGFLKIGDRCRKAFALHKRIWDVFRATNADEFTQRMQTLRSSAQPKAIP